MRWPVVSAPRISDRTDMLEWVKQHDDIVLALGIFSIVCFVASLVAIPILVARIPQDYFAHRRRHRQRSARHPVIAAAVVVLKNLTGAVLVLAGIAMLVLPGQGILTILMGLLVMDFPGKFALERRLIRQPAVLHSLNWIREKAQKPPLRLDAPSPSR